MKPSIPICFTVFFVASSVQAQETAFAPINTTAIGLNPFGDSFQFGPSAYKVATYGLGWYEEDSQLGPTLYASGYGGFKWFASNLLRMSMDGFGNVGIGTSTPQSLLAVNGKITAKSISVTLAGWPDYVFTDSYSLRSLKQLSKYVTLNKHLPNMPTAEDVSKGGVDLGETQKKLLRKVEELTLYIIKQDKRLDKQATEIKLIKKRLSPEK